MRRVAWLSLLLGLACAGSPEPVAQPEPASAPPDVPPETSPPPSLSAYRSPARPAFPLTVGDRWHWQVTRSTGAGMRVLLIPTEPARTDIEEEWDLTIDGVTGDRYAVTWTRTKPGGLPSTTALVLWHQGAELWMQGPTGPTPALTITVPPEPVATEKVPCIAHFLADLPGVCSPAPGGPLDVAPGPVHGVVWQEDEGGRGLAQVLIGIGTAGMLIPGNKTATIYADLTAWTPKIPAPRSERVDWWKAHHDPIRFESLLGGPPLDREEAAALVALAGPDIVGSANAVMRRVRAEDRVAIVRVALGTRDDGRLELLAHLVVSLGEPTSGERLASVLALLPEDDQAAGRGLLTGEWRYLGDVLRAPEAERESALERVLTGPPAPGEAEAIVRAFEEPGPALTLLLPKVAPGDRLPLLTDVSERQSFDDQRLTLLDGREDLLAQADLAAIGRLVDTYTFDEGKRKAVDRILAVTPGPKRGPVLRLGVEKMSFDDARLELLDAWPAEAHALSKADKQAVLGAFVFKEEEARARLR